MNDKSNAHNMILIALGGNRPLSDCPPRRTLLKALRALEGEGDIAVAARSDLWNSPAWPDPEKPAYVNAAARLETALSPEDLMRRLLALEKTFGRERDAEDRWASRTLDLDLIDYDGWRVESALLTLPHPRAHERAFVLKPVQDIAPLWAHPVHGTLDEMLARLPADAFEGLTRLRKPFSQAHNRP